MLIEDIYNPTLLVGYSAEERIMSSGLRPIYEELRRIIFDTKVIISKRETVKGKGRDTTGAPKLAAGLNKAFKIGLESADWEPLPAPGGDSRNLIDWFKSVKPSVQYAPEPGIGVEIQFGNNYQFNEDLKRLTEAYLSGKMWAGISIVVSDKLAKHKADRGAHFSDAKKKLDRYLKTLYGTGAKDIPPLMIISIHHDGYNEKMDGSWEISPVALNREGEILETTPKDKLFYPQTHRTLDLL